MALLFKKCFCVFLLIYSTLLCSQESATESSASFFEKTSQNINKLLDSLGADGEFDSSKSMDWSVLPGPFYAPETSLGLGVSAVGLYKIDKNDTSQPSSLTINGIVSINGALGARILSKTFLFEDSLRIFLDADVQNIPDVFYGQGIKNGKNDANKLDFDLVSHRFTPEIFVKIFSSTYMSFGFDIYNNEAHNVDFTQYPQAPIDSASTFPMNSFSAGPIWGVVYDSRDYMLNASEGRLIQLDVSFYNETFASDSDFEKVRFNYSDYQVIPSIDSIIAWQWMGEFNFGDVPWDQFSKLGGPTRLRGYEMGRYRDVHMTLMQVELRQHLVGRHGVVYWLGAGTMASEFEDLGDDDWLHSAGIGYRFRVKDRSNMRLDIGFGEGEKGAYFSINEAF